jgi:hypothetical protein
MSSTITDSLGEPVDRPGSAGVERSEPGGRAQRRAGAARRLSPPRPELAEEVKVLLSDERERRSSSVRFLAGTARCS